MLQGMLYSKAKIFSNISKLNHTHQKNLRSPFNSYPLIVTESNTVYFPLD